MLNQAALCSFLMDMNYQNFPSELLALPQWVCWRKVFRDGKWTKVPYQIDGVKASSTNRDTWTTFENCLQNINRFDGLGFCFTAGYIGIDLDHCFDASGELRPWAFDVVSQFDTYTEKSPSGEGLHIILKSDVDIAGRGRRKDWIDEEGGKRSIECYSFGRYFTVTGDVFKEKSSLKECEVSAWMKETFVEVEVTQASSFPTAPKLPPDQKILSVMFNAKGGEKLRKLYMEGGETGSDDSKNDLVLVGALMFYCGNRRTDVDRLFRASKLYREKWDRHGDSYAERTMEKAQKSDIMEWKFYNESLILDRHGVPLDNMENICITLRGDKRYQGQITMNADSGRLELFGKEMQDNHVLEITAYLQRTYAYFAEVKKGNVFDAISLLASENVTYPRREFIRSLVWDGVARLDLWLHRVCGTPDDEVHRAISANWIKGLVRRITEPACQFDEVLVLSGVQGCGKSTVFRTLGGGVEEGPGSNWHVETTSEAGSKDMMMLFRNKAIVEFAEGATMSKKDAAEIKGIISQVQDSYRAPYGKLDQTIKRSCVFGMTTNSEEYLTDTTGNRRFLPVKVCKTREDQCDTAYLREVREQLFAEAFYRVDVLKETSHIYPLAMLQKSQEGAQVTDEYDEAIASWYERLPEEDKERGVTGLEVWADLIHSKKETEKIPIMTIKDQKWIASIFQRHLKLTSKLVRTGDKVGKRWVRG